MKVDRILALPINRLGLSSTSRNSVVEFVKRHQDPEFRVRYDAKRLKLLQELSASITVKDMIDALEAKARPTPAAMRSYAMGRSFSQKLVELGMTQLDWIALPNSTVTTTMLKRLGKEKLRSLSVLVLDTLSSTALERLRWHTKKDVRETTIQDLLDFNPLEDRRHMDRSFVRSFAQSFLNTRNRLLELGFRYEDGLFLQVGTKRQLAEDLMKTESLSKQMAYKFVEIAAKRRMVAELVG